MIDIGMIEIPVDLTIMTIEEALVGNKEMGEEIKLITETEMTMVWLPNLLTEQDLVDRQIQEVEITTEEGIAKEDTPMNMNQDRMTENGIKMRKITVPGTMTDMIRDKI